MFMKKNKGLLLIYIFIFVSIIATVSFSYAYFATINKTTGNDKNLNIVTEDLGSIKWQGTKVFVSNDLLPGEMGIQTFTIEKNSTTGKGIYEIDLKGIIDEAFNKDVEIILYKTTDTANNNVSIEEGSSSSTGVGTLHYAKEDKLKITGTPKVVYGPKALQNKNPIILEQADFDNSNFNKTTYYLVYHYKNTDVSQDEQQGKSFSGEISVRLILEKGNQEEDGPQGLAKDIITLAQTDTTNLAIDDYGNTRYIGSNPNNYVSIDGDIWRIIGVMKNVDDGTGNKEDRVKLIRSESIGGYSWDTSESSINKGNGVNEWNQADLMKLLNSGYESESVGGSLYWNNQSGTCYNGSKNATTSCNFTSTGIKDKLKALISDAVWNTGANDGKTYTYNNIKTAKFYELERSSNTGKNCSSETSCNDTAERTTTWTGKVGLMYPSDYGYATSGDIRTDRATCLNSVLYSWNSYSDCYNNNWLFNSSYQWTLSPNADSSHANFAFDVYSDGSVHCSSASIDFAVRPVVYLISNVGVQSGEGTRESPYQF